MLFLHLLSTVRKSIHDDRKEQLQHNERAYHNQDWEVDSSNEARSIHVVVHNSGPPLEGDDSEDRENGSPYIVEGEEALLDVLPIPHLIDIKGNPLLKKCVTVRSTVAFIQPPTSPLLSLIYRPIVGIAEGTI